MISAGHLEHHHHPSGAAVDMALSYLAGQDFKTTPHYITYYRVEGKGKAKTHVYNRRYTQWPLFSTITNGMLGVDLMDTESCLTSSRQKQPLFLAEKSKKFIPIKIWRFSTQEQMDLSIEGVSTSLTAENKALILWREEPKEPRLTRRGPLERTYKIQPLSLFTTSAAGGSSSSMPPSSQNFVIRHKIKEGSPEQWVLYNVEPVEEEK